MNKTGKRRLFMRILVASDTHHDKHALYQAILSQPTAQVVIHLGDGADEAEEGPEGAAKEPGVGSKLKEEIEEEVAEHFSSDKWHAPKNPFKGKGKRK